MVPTRRAQLFSWCVLALAALPILDVEAGVAIWLVGLGLGLLGVAVDAATLPRLTDLAVRWSAPTTLVVGRAVPLSVHVQAPPGLWGTSLQRPIAVEATLTPAPRLGRSQVSRAEVPARGEATLHLDLAPRERGPTRLGVMELRCLGWLGLWWRRWRVELDAEVSVVLPSLSAHAPTARALRGSSGAGARIERHPGEGSEFVSLQAYGPEHDHRRIDWKASARLQRPLVRTFRAERDRPVVIALDTGHLMRARVGAMTRLDHGILAAQSLAATASRLGDRVGLFAFDARPLHWRPPSKGQAALSGLIRAMGGLDASDAETNFALGLKALSRHLPRKSLLFILTEFVDTSSAAIMLEHLGRLAGRHAVVFVTLRDEALADLSAAPPDDHLTLHGAVTARALLDGRDRVFKRLRREGIPIIEASADALPTRLITTYRQLKRDERA